MSNTTSTFPHDLGISTRIGLTRGVGQPLNGFAESEIQYREQRARALAERRAQLHAARKANKAKSRSAANKSGGTRRELMSRWTTWFQSAQERRSSAGSSSSTGCSS